MFVPIKYFYYKDFETQNRLLKKYLAANTGYLISNEFLYSPACFFYYPAFAAEECHDDSRINLFALLNDIVLTRNFLMPIRFKDNVFAAVNQQTVKKVENLFFISPDLPIAQLNDKDYESFDFLTEQEYEDQKSVLFIQ